MTIWGNQAMHLSREIRRFEMDDLSSRRGDRRRYSIQRNVVIKIHLTAVCFVSAVAIAAGCRPQEPIAESTLPEWESKHFDVSVELPNGWRATHMNTPGDTYDRADQSVAAFLNKAELCTYIVRLEPDAPLDQLSMDAYLPAVKAQFESQPGYTFLDHDQINFHNGVFERLRFRVVGGEKKSVMHVCIHRDGEHLVTIQMGYPVHGVERPEIPQLLASFDSGVSLDVQDLSRKTE